MRFKKTTLLLLVAVMGFAVTGCSSMDSSRKDAAQRRWERTMDQARLQAAQESIEQGQLAYAEQILEDCSTDSPDHEKTLKMLTKVRNTHYQFAKARQEDQSPEEQVY